jgi:hypothetical protein
MELTSSRRLPSSWGQIDWDQAGVEIAHGGDNLYRVDGAPPDREGRPIQAHPSSSRRRSMKRAGIATAGPAAPTITAVRPL